MNKSPLYMLRLPGEGKIQVDIIPDFATMKSITYYRSGKVKEIVFRTAEEILAIGPAFLVADEKMAQQ